MESTMSSMQRKLQRSMRAKETPTDNAQTEETVQDVSENNEVTEQKEEATKPNRAERRRSQHFLRKSGRKVTQQHVDSPDEWNKRMKWILYMDKLRANAAEAKKNKEIAEVTLGKVESEEVVG